MLLSMGALLLTSVLLFRKPNLGRFFGSISYAYRILESGTLPWVQMPTTLVAALLAGIPLPAAQIIHAVIACLAAGISLYVWMKKAPIYLCASTIVIASLLITPHANTHDLAILAIPLSFLGWQIYLRNRPNSELSLLSLSWVLPAICVPLAAVLKLQIAPFILTALLIRIFQEFKVTPPSIRSKIVSDDRGLTTKWKSSLTPSKNLNNSFG